jgi:hypothetical protein
MMDIIGRKIILAKTLTERKYGFYRSYIEQVIHCYLDCGDHHTMFLPALKNAVYKWQ